MYNVITYPLKRITERFNCIYQYIISIITDIIDMIIIYNIYNNQYKMLCIFLIKRFYKCIDNIKNLCYNENIEKQETALTESVKSLNVRKD